MQSNQHKQSEVDANDRSKLRIFIFATVPKPFSSLVVQIGMTGDVEAARKTQQHTAGADNEHAEQGPRMGGNMKNITKWMLAAALAIGGLGLAATPAKAAQIGFYIGNGAPGYYVPPSPGPGYTWIDGYYANGYWVPGRWAFAGVYRGHDDFYRHYDRDHWRRDHDRDHFDHDRRRDRDRGRVEYWRSR